MTQSRDQQHNINVGTAPARPPPRCTIQVQRGDRPRVGVNAAQEGGRGKDAFRVGHAARDPGTLFSIVVIFRTGREISQLAKSTFAVKEEMKLLL